MTAPERIETERLVLRRPAVADATAIFARYASDPEVTRFLGWPTHRTVEESERFVAASDAEWSRWPAGPFLAEDRATGQLLGGTGLGFETAMRAMTGFVFARDAWGRGYASESLAAMVDLALRLGVRRVYALCHPSHVASIHVLEKNGFAREGILHAFGPFPNLPAPDPGDVVCLARVIA